MDKFTFKNTLIPLAIVLIISGCVKKNDPEKVLDVQNNPNIIFVLADDLGYGDIAVFNPNSKIPTPNLDKMAGEGMKFTDAHTSSAVCTPTRYGILTGRYNWRSKLKQGVLGGKSKALIPNDRTTLASLLKKQNYQTAFIGKWHLGWDWAVKNVSDTLSEGWNQKDNVKEIDFSKPVKNNPNDLGFDYAYGHCGSLDMAPYVYVENGMATAIPTEKTVNKGNQSWWREGLTAPDFIHEDVTPNFFRRAISYVKEKASDDEPFFLYLPLPSPHTPILPTKEYQGKSGLDNDYGDFVMMVDGYMGQLLEQIKKSGIEENTLIVFTSDNGCSPQANFKQLETKGHDPSAIYRGHKADIYEGGHRVPFIVKWPSTIKAGTICDKTICTTDFFATCAEITKSDLKSNEGEDSFSILPILENHEASNYLREATVHHSINGSFAIRKDNWKLIFCPGSGGWSVPRPNSEKISELPKFQLYDLSNDPEEKTNLYEKNPGIVKELKSLMESYINNGRSTSGEKVENEPGFNGKWKQLNVFNLE